MCGKPLILGDPPNIYGDIIRNIRMFLIDQNQDIIEHIYFLDKISEHAFKTIL